MAINTFIGSGYLKQLEIGEFGSGDRWARFTLQISSYAGKNEDGTAKYEVGYINCKSYSQFVVDRLEANIPLRDDRDTMPPMGMVSGELRYDSWEDNDGNKRSNVYVRVNEAMLGEVMKTDGSRELATAGSSSDSPF